MSPSLIIVVNNTAKIEQPKFLKLKYTRLTKKSTLTQETQVKPRHIHQSTYHQILTNYPMNFIPILRQVAKVESGTCVFFLGTQSSHFSRVSITLSDGTHITCNRLKKSCFCVKVQKLNTSLLFFLSHNQDTLNLHNFKATFYTFYKNKNYLPFSLQPFQNVALALALPRAVSEAVSWSYPVPVEPSHNDPYTQSHSLENIRLMLHWS